MSYHNHQLQQSEVNNSQRLTFAVPRRTPTLHEHLHPQLVTLAPPTHPAHPGFQHHLYRGGGEVNFWDHPSHHLVPEAISCGSRGPETQHQTARIHPAAYSFYHEPDRPAPYFWPALHPPAGTPSSTPMYHRRSSFCPPPGGVVPEASPAPTNNVTAPPSHTMRPSIHSGDAVYFFRPGRAHRPNARPFLSPCQDTHPGHVDPPPFAQSTRVPTRPGTSFETFRPSGLGQQTIPGQPPDTAANRSCSTRPQIRQRNLGRRSSSQKPTSWIDRLFKTTLSFSDKHSKDATQEDAAGGAPPAEPLLHTPLPTGNQLIMVPSQPQIATASPFVLQAPLERALFPPQTQFQLHPTIYNNSNVTESFANMNTPAVCPTNTDNAALRTSCDNPSPPSASTHETCSSGAAPTTNPSRSAPSRSASPFSSEDAATFPPPSDVQSVGATPSPRDKSDDTHSSPSTPSFPHLTSSGADDCFRLTTNDSLGGPSFTGDPSGQIAAAQDQPRHLAAWRGHSCAAPQIDADRGFAASSTFVRIESFAAESDATPGSPATSFSRVTTPEVVASTTTVNSSVKTPSCYSKLSSDNHPSEEMVAPSSPDETTPPERASPSVVYPYNPPTPSSNSPHAEAEEMRTSSDATGTSTTNSTICDNTGTSTTNSTICDNTGTSKVVSPPSNASAASSISPVASRRGFTTVRCGYISFGPREEPPPPTPSPSQIDSATKPPPSKETVAFNQPRKMLLSCSVVNISAGREDASPVSVPQNNQLNASCYASLQPVALSSDDLDFADISEVENRRNKEVSEVDTRGDRSEDAPNIRLSVADRTPLHSDQRLSSRSRRGSRVGSLHRRLKRHLSASRDTNKNASQGSANAITRPPGAKATAGEASLDNIPVLAPGRGQTVCAIPLSVRAEQIHHLPNHSLPRHHQAAPRSSTTKTSELLEDGKQVTAGLVFSPALPNENRDPANEDRFSALSDEKLFAHSAKMLFPSSGCDERPISPKPSLSTGNPFPSTLGPGCPLEVTAGTQSSLNMDELPAIAGRNNHQNFDELFVETLPVGIPPETFECTACHRHFTNPTTFSKHAKACEKVFTAKAKQKVTTTAFGGRTAPEAQSSTPLAKAPVGERTPKKRNWRMESAHLRANAGSQETTPIATPPMFDSSFECESCGRTFNEHAHARHVAICRAVFGKSKAGGRLVKGGGRLAAQRVTAANANGTTEGANATTNTKGARRQKPPQQKQKQPAQSDRDPVVPTANFRIVHKLISSPSAANRAKIGTSSKTAFTTPQRNSVAPRCSNR